MATIERVFYFGEYSLSNDSEIKLKNNEDFLLKQNIQPHDAGWNSLFKIEKQNFSIEDEGKYISMEIDANELPQNFDSKDCHNKEVASSQFIITQVEKKPKDTIATVENHHLSELELINFIDLIYETLEDNNRTLNSDDLKNINHSYIYEIMERLSHQLSLNGIYNLCNSLCSVENDISADYVKAVCTKILLQRIIELEKSQQTTKMIPVVVGRMTKKFPEDIHKWIFIPMINADLKDTTVPLVIIKCYTGHRKMILISDFLMTVKELKVWHVNVLASIIDVRIEDNMKDRLLTLLLERAVTSSKDKIYSKFILSFIKSNSPFTESQKRMLEEIITVNDTIFKTAMTQILLNM